MGLGSVSAPMNPTNGRCLNRDQKFGAGRKGLGVKGKFRQPFVMTHRPSSFMPAAGWMGDGPWGCLSLLTATANQWPASYSRLGAPWPPVDRLTVGQIDNDARDIARVRGSGRDAGRRGSADCCRAAHRRQQSLGPPQTSLMHRCEIG